MSLLLAVIFLLAVSVAFALKDHHSLLILKLRRSGSTYFTSLVGQQQGVWVVPQLVRQGLVTSEAETLELLANALDQPYHAKKDDLKNLVQADEELHRLPVIGYSLNPMHNSSSIFLPVEPVREMLKARNATLVLYVRTNYVKHAVAALRSTCLAEKCDISNPINTATAGMWQKGAIGFRPDLIPGSELYNNTVTCEIGKKHYYPLVDLQCAMVWHYDAFIAMRDYSQKIADKYITVHYEELQKNAAGVLRHLFNVIDAGGNHNVSSLPPRDIRTTEFTVKHTDESLRETIVNFDQLLMSFGTSCLIEMLTNIEPRKVMLDRCPPPASWREQCQNLLVTGRPNRSHCALLYENEKGQLMPVVVVRTSAAQQL